MSTTNPQLDPSFDPSAHRIISFHELMEQNTTALHQLKQEFIARGWCIIKLPDSAVEKSTKDETREYWGDDKQPPELFKFPINVKTAGESLKAFFARPEKEKATVTGYSSVPHKESIHITTPTSFRQNPPPQEIIDWCALWDEVTVTLLEIISTPLFGIGKATLSHRADLPIAWAYHRGMLDVAHYLNKQTATLSHEIGFSTEDVNCVPHYDPGLLSISFFSSHEGLQLKDPQTDTWFAGPVNTVAGQEDLGVIWLGEAAVKASKNQFREGVHRVVYPQTPVSRITAWYEMCTTDQVNEEIKATPAPAKDVSIKLPNLPKSKKIKLTPLGGDTKRQIERQYGIPPSKSGDPFKNQYFRAKYSEDRSKEERENDWDDDF